MTKLNYSNYLKDKNFDIEKEYKKIFTSLFQITTKSKNKKQTIIRSQFRVNNKNIFHDKKNKSLEEVFTIFKEKKNR